MSIPPEALQKVRYLPQAQCEIARSMLINTVITTARARDRVESNCGTTTDQHRQNTNRNKTA